MAVNKAFPYCLSPMPPSVPVLPDIIPDKDGQEIMALFRKICYNCEKDNSI